jgi:hypothetical protein
MTEEGRKDRSRGKGERRRGRENGEGERRTWH